MCITCPLFEALYCTTCSILVYCVMFSAGVDGAAVPGPAAVRGSSQLSVDGGLALSHDAGLSHSHRPEHASGSEGTLQGGSLLSFMSLFIVKRKRPQGPGKPIQGYFCKLIFFSLHL